MKTTKKTPFICPDCGAEKGGLMYESQKPRRCKDCWEIHKDRTCSICGGTKSSRAGRCWDCRPKTTKSPCPDCGGSKSLGSSQCSDCFIQLNAVSPRHPYCQIEDCDGLVKSKGYCVKHYTRWLRTGDPNLSRKDPTPKPRFCSFCGNQTGPIAKSPKYCSKHCSKWDRREKQNFYIPTMKMCDKCLNEFWPETRIQSLCSIKCQPIKEGKTPPPGMVALFYLRDPDTSQILYVGASKRNFKFVVSSLKNTIRPSLIKTWLQDNPPPIFSLIGLITPEESKATLKKERQALFTQGHPLLHSEWRIISDESLESRKKESKKKERANHDSNRRRAKKVGARTERIIRKKVYESFHKSCAYCGCALPPKGWHLDHIIALANGGSHTYDNLCAACPECNSLKRDLTLEEFFQILLEKV